jgi:hypothetical protein
MDKTKNQEKVIKEFKPIKYQEYEKLGKEQKNQYNKQEQQYKLDRKLKRFANAGKNKLNNFFK